MLNPVVIILLFLASNLNAQSLSLSGESAGFVEIGEFPRPTILLPNIAFWKKIYSEYTSNQIVFSDSEDLGLVYRVVTVPAAGKARENAIKHAKQEILTALDELQSCEPESVDVLEPGLTREIYLALSSNPRVDKYQRGEFIRAQNGLKDRFEEGYHRSGAHDAEIRARLKNAGLPEDLIGIVFVESLFYPKSKSSVGATGIWQFMKRTAFEFMRVNQLVDERQDPILSTDAAIKYLKSARKSLQEWPLVITSYNYGRGGMAKAAEMVGSKDFEVILKNYSNPRFGFAARNYYAEFLAALDVYRNASAIFPNTEPVSQWSYAILELPKSILVKDLLSSKSLESVWLKTYNPALTNLAHKGKAVLPKGFTLRVPVGHKTSLEKKLSYMPERKQKKSRKCNFTELSAPVTQID